MTGAPVATERDASRASAPARLADGAYAQLKQDIFDFQLVPGDRFSEAEVAVRLGISRTPVREALFRLQSEGYLDVTARSGWVVRPLDFELFEHLYDLRMVLETTAVARLSGRTTNDDGADDDRSLALEALREIWLVDRGDRLTDGQHVAGLDERFHMALVEAAGNPELARVHREVTERIRIIRRLDFTQAERIEITYDEHAGILSAILAGRADVATQKLCAHIDASKAEVRKITLHCLHQATRMRR
jgi:DNA-binding GntR family transcriptional regulator